MGKQLLNLQDVLYEYASRYVASLGIQVDVDNASVVVEILRADQVTVVHLTFTTFSRHGTGSESKVTRRVVGSVISPDIVNEMILEFRQTVNNNKKHFYN